MLVKYCNANCQKNHWPKHKIECKQHAAELHNEALFKDPPAKEDCPICFLPMPIKLITCVSLPPATISSVPIYDFAIANERLAKKCMEEYYKCCGKSICGGCIKSFCESGNMGTCPFCKAEILGKADEERVQDIMKRVDVNDAGVMTVMASNYYHGQLGWLQDQTKAMDLYARAAELGSAKAHFFLGNIYFERGDSKKEKFHYEAAAMAGHEVARYNLGAMEYDSKNLDRAVKHFTIAASSGCSTAMHNLRNFYERGWVSRESINSSLAAYNNSCVEMRSEARDAYVRFFMVKYL